MDLCRQTRSASSDVLELLEHAHDGEPVARLGAVAALAHEPQEVRELEPQRLVARDLRAEDVAGARLPLAEGLRGLLGPFS